jgi:hypothetical protein
VRGRRVFKIAAGPRKKIGARQGSPQHGRLEPPADNAEVIGCAYSLRHINHILRIPLSWGLGVMTPLEDSPDEILCGSGKWADSRTGLLKDCACISPSRLTVESCYRNHEDDVVATQFVERTTSTLQLREH